VDIELVKPGDEARLRAWWEVEDAARQVDAPWLPTNPVQELLLEDDTNRRSSRRERHVAVLDGRVVGGVSLELPLLDNTETLVASAMVHPDHRRHGIGRQLFDHAVARAHHERRPLLIGEVAEPLDVATVAPGAAFATSVGARRALSEICRALDLDAALRHRLSALAETSRKHAAGYELVQWAGPAPDELVDDLARLQALMSTDAPLDDLQWSPEVWDAARIREGEEEAAAKERVWVTTGARHVSSGRLVAYTDIGVSTHLPDTAYQWTTIVDREHRGHRLGMLVKTANIALLAAELPGVQRVITWNAETNDHMVAINEEMGFRRVGRWAEWQLEVPPA
jgi:GNAT superfamily N-acetyltransferase